MEVGISIITACYNASDTLVDCLGSLESQTYPFEHVIVDGCSSDASMSVVEKFKTANTRIVSEPDSGVYDAMNKGLSLARGQVIGFLNADDSYADPEVLASVAEVFADPQVDSCYGDLVYVERMQPNRIVRCWRSGRCHWRRWYWGYMVPHPTFFVRKTIYERYGGFLLDLGSAADYELMLRFLVRYKISTRYIPRVLIRMKTGGLSNRSLAARVSAHQMDHRAWAENGLRPYPWTLLCKPIRKVPQWFQRGCG